MKTIGTYRGDLEIIDEFFSTIDGNRVVLVVDRNGSIIPFMECKLYTGYYCGGTPVELKVNISKLFAIPFSLMEGIMVPFKKNKYDNN